jgi:adenosine deaminase CECR1
MYAELRPMLLDKSIRTDDGKGNVDHAAQMRIILQEIERKRAQLEAEGASHKFPFGIKIIYSTPRSIPKERMKRELNDCISLKLQFPDLICGKWSKSTKEDS